MKELIKKRSDMQLTAAYKLAIQSDVKILIVNTQYKCIFFIASENLTFYNQCLVSWKFLIDVIQPEDIAQGQIKYGERKLFSSLWE